MNVVSWTISDGFPEGSNTLDARRFWMATMSALPDLYGLKVLVHQIRNEVSKLTKIPFLI